MSKKKKTCSNCGNFSIPNSCGGCKDKDMWTLLIPLKIRRFYKAIGRCFYE